jgi:hypothetical protein
MNEPEKQENLYQISIQPNYSLLRFKIRRILSPEFKLNVESKCSTQITQKIWLKLARFEERAEKAGKCCKNLYNLLFYYRITQSIGIIS